MNTLIATGTGAAFVYSVIATVAPRLVAAGETTDAGGMTMSGAMTNGMTTNGAAMSGAVMSGAGVNAASVNGAQAVMTSMVPVYFEAASVIIALILLGRLLEARARG